MTAIEIHDVIVAAAKHQIANGRDSQWFDTKTGKRVRQPACIKRVADKLRIRAKRRRERLAR